MVSKSWLQSTLSRFFSQISHEFRKIYAGGASFETTPASEAGPQVLLLKQFVPELEEGFFNYQTRRKGRQNPRNRAAPCADAAVEAIISPVHLYGFVYIHAATPREDFPRSIMRSVNEVTMAAKRAPSAEETH
jgi:hypothetical protein